jgi:DNA-binding transcriptional regulator YhcF (GntR family)
VRELPDTDRPRYRELADDLRRRIKSGELTDFPSMREIADTYGVGMHTVRPAVAVLVDEGLLIRERGLPYQIAPQGDRMTVVASAQAAITARTATPEDTAEHRVREGELVLVIADGGEEWLYPAASTVIRFRA